MMTKDKRIIGYRVPNSDSFTELATPVKMSGRRSMLKVIRDKDDNDDDGISGDAFGYSVARNPDSPIKNVLPTELADAAMIENTGDMFLEFWKKLLAVQLSVDSSGSLMRGTDKEIL